MADLGALKPKDSYQQLLTLESNSISGSLKKVQDGAGAETSLELSTSTAKVDGNLEVTGTSTLTGNATLTGNLTAGGTLTLSSTPTQDTAEATALVIDSNGLVKRNEMVTSSNTLFLPPTLVMRADVSGLTLNDSFKIPDAKSIANTTANRSYEIDNLSELSMTTTGDEGKIAVATTGVARIDVNLLLNITSANTDIDLVIRTEDTAGTPTVTDVQTINRTHETNSTKTAIGFSLFIHMTEGHKAYYAIKLSSGAASLLSDSTFTVTKLTRE